jgi:hypothetical protein
MLRRMANGIMSFLIIASMTQASTIVIVCPYENIDYDSVNVYNLEDGEFDENYRPDLSCIDDVEFDEYTYEEEETKTESDEAYQWYDRPLIWRPRFLYP